MEPENSWVEEFLHAKEGEDGQGDGRIQSEQAPLGQQGRPEGKEQGSGNSDRPQGVEPGPTLEQVKKFQQEWGERVNEREDPNKQRQRAEEAARQGNVLGFKVRVFLTDIQGSWIEFGVNIPWSEWLQRLNAYHGIAHDTGFIPLHAIKLIVHVDAQGNHNLTMGENIVPFKRPPA